MKSCSAACIAARRSLRSPAKQHDRLIKIGQIGAAPEPRQQLTAISEPALVTSHAYLT
jgi:hypothetical protein